MLRKDCFAYVSKYKCKALSEIDCTNCRFYTEKKKYEERIKKYEKIHNREDKYRQLLSQIQGEGDKFPY